MAAIRRPRFRVGLAGAWLTVGASFVWLLGASCSAADDAKIQQFNYQATKEAIQRAVDGTPTQGVRVSLGAARNRAELAQALQLLAATLRLPPVEIQIV